MFYEAYGAVLSSTVTLPEHSTHRHADPDLFVTSSNDLPIDGEWHWVAPRDRPSESWLAVATGPEGYRHRFDGGGEFVVSMPDRRITAIAGSADLATTRHLLIDQVL